MITQLPIWPGLGRHWSWCSVPLGHELGRSLPAAPLLLTPSALANATLPPWGHQRGQQWLCSAQQEMAPWGHQLLAGGGWEGAMGNFAPTSRAAVPAGAPAGALQAPGTQALLAQAHCGPCTGSEADVTESPARVPARHRAPAEASGDSSVGTCPLAGLCTAGWVPCTARRLRLEANAEITQFSI